MSVVKSCCNTEVKFVKQEYTWTINNFSLLRTKNTGEYLISSTFPDSTDVEPKWCLKLYPNWDGERSKQRLCIFLCLVSYSKSRVTANFKFSIIIDSKLQESCPAQMTQTFTTGSGWGFMYSNVFLNIEKHQDDKLTIFCEINCETDLVNISGQSNVISVQVPKCDLSRDLETQFENPKFSDVILSTGGSEFKAHKHMLSARSPVFSAMFEHDMEERKNNRVEITDIEQNVLREMLRFIYSGKVDEMETIADKLLIAADKYELERLKLMCEEHLCKTLTVENAADVLLLADLHNADQLKAQTIEFIKLHAKEVINSDEWKSLTESQTPITFRLITQVLQALSTTEPPQKKFKQG